MYNIIYLDKVTSRDIPKLSPPIKAMVKSAIEEKLLADPIKFGKPLRYQDLRYVIINKLKTLDVKVRFYSASLHKLPECMGIMRNIA